MNVQDESGNNPPPGAAGGSENIWFVPQVSNTPNFRPWSFIYTLQSPVFLRAFFCAAHSLFNLFLSIPFSIGSSSSSSFFFFFFRPFFRLPLLKGRRGGAQRRVPQSVPPGAQGRRAVQGEKPRKHSARIQDHAGKYRLCLS